MSDSNELRILLANHGLEEYYNDLIKDGFDSLESFSLIEDDNLNESFKIGHRKLLLSLALKLKNEFKEVKLLDDVKSSVSITTTTSSTNQDNNDHIVTSIDDNESNSTTTTTTKRKTVSFDEDTKPGDQQPSTAVVTTQQTTETEIKDEDGHVKKKQRSQIVFSKSFFKRATARETPYDHELPVFIPGPKIRILLVRHGQSEANVDHTLYQRVSDHAIGLSELGKQQAKEAGEAITKYLKSIYGKDQSNVHCRLWSSCYKRARQTADIVKENCNFINSQREDILLGEQQFGTFEGIDWGSGIIDDVFPNEIRYYRKAAKFAGRFYAKVPLGESRMDVCLRVKQFFGTIQRDATRHGITDLIIVSHGVTIRAFLMMWLHLTPEWFELETNPQNCSVRVIEKCMDRGFIHKGQERPRRDLLLSTQDNKVHV